MYDIRMASMSFVSVWMFCCCWALAKAGEWPWNPVASPSQIVFCDANSRFTVLSILGVRAEYGNEFEDRPTYAFGNRQLQGSPTFTVDNATSWCNITIREDGYPSLMVSYNKIVKPVAFGTANKFKAHQLSIRNSDGIVYSDSANVTTNLGGTVYSLSGVNGSIPLTCRSQETSDPSCTNGMLSVSGWTVYNDGKNNVYDSDGWWNRSVHAVNEPDGSQDLYMFVFGNRYREALQLLSFLTGRQPVPPRRFFGVWWSKYFKYSQTDLRHIIDEYESNGIPLDGINLDTEWHRNTNWLDREATATWYGGQFDWDTSLYPDPMKMVSWLESLGLWPVWFDIHQIPGVLPSNSAFATFAEKMGLPKGYNHSVLPNVANSTFSAAFFDLLDEQVGGTNYWWLDNGMPTAVPLAPLPLSTLNSFFWDRYLFFKDAEDRGKLGRPTVMGPFAGLGTHRYPFIHSGDTITSWATLEFVIYYTSTSSNVLAGLITHDIGGHRDYSAAGNNPEMYTRFVQFGVFSAMMRPHPAKTPSRASPDKTFIRRIWEYPYEEFQEMRKRMRLRARMVPYLYTINIQTYLSGVPFLRGVYVDWPQLATKFFRPSVYQNLFLFGDNFLVAPPFRPMSESNLTAVDVLLPTLSSNNVWVNFDDGGCYVGGTEFSLNATIFEFPAFVKAGSILPFSVTPTTTQSIVKSAKRKSEDMLQLLDPPIIGAAKQLPSTIVWEVFLGNATNGSGQLIEDDGVSTSYQNGSYATTATKYTVSGEVLMLTVEATDGSFDGQPQTREHRWKIHNVLAPLSVARAVKTTIPGRGTSIVKDSTGVSWEWDAASLTTTIYTPFLPANESMTVHVTFMSSDGYASESLCSSSGQHAFPLLHKRIQYVKRAIDSEAKEGTLPSLHLNRVEETADKMQNDPNQSADVLASYVANVKEAITKHLNHPYGGSSHLKAVMRDWFSMELECKVPQS